MASTTESAREAIQTFPRRVFTDPAFLQDQAEARACGVTVGLLRNFKRRHRLPLDQRLSPDARELLALELETADRVAKGEQLERARALALIAERATPEAAAAIAAVMPFGAQFSRAGVWVFPWTAEAYLLSRVEALTGKRYMAIAAAKQRAATLAPAAALAAAGLRGRDHAHRDRLTLFWGVVLRLDQLEGPPPADPVAFYAWCQLEAYKSHHCHARDLGDLLAGRIGSGDARGLLELPESGPLDPAAIRSAYRAQARQHHPDAGGDRQRFERLSAARDRLLLEVV